MPVRGIGRHSSTHQPGGSDSISPLMGDLDFNSYAALNLSGVGRGTNVANVVRTATVVVAANDAATAAKAQADYICDGVDDQVEIQAAIDSLPNGGLVYLSEGIFHLSGKVLISKTYGVKLTGASGAYGSHGTVLKWDGGADAALEIYAAYNTTISDISLYQDNLTTDSIGIYINGDNNPPVHGVWLERIGITKFDVGIKLMPSDSSNQIANFSLSDFQISECNIGIESNSVNIDVMKIEGGEIVVPSAGYGIVTNRIGGTNTIKSVEFAHPGPGGIAVEIPTGAISTLRLEECTSEGASYFVRVGSDAAPRLLIENSVIDAPIEWNGSPGIMQIENCQVNHPVELKTDAYLLMVNCWIQSTITLTSYGSFMKTINCLHVGDTINLDGGKSGWISFYDHGSPTVNITGAQADYIKKRFRFENSGTATITAGNTSVNVTHGLATTPTTVQLTPTTDTAGKRYWISAKGDTTFTITIDSSHTANISFDWRAAVGEGN